MVDRRGFVLLTVLWTLAGASTLALVVALQARNGIDTSQNELSAARAYWSAEGCASQMLAEAAAVIAAPPDISDPQRNWRNLDRLAPPASDSGALARCATRLESYGSRLDLARADESDFRALFVAVGIDSLRADSLVAATLDWRDDDDQPRDRGAERAWYLAAGRVGPRNGRFGDAHELLRVRGFDELGAARESLLVRLVAPQGDLIDLAHAPGAVLQTLPGFSPVVADAVVSLRERSAGAWDLSHLVLQLPRPARDSVEANFDRLVTRAATQPSHWLLTSVGASGVPAVSVHLELLLASGNGRVGVVRRRYWVE